MRCLSLLPVAWSGSGMCPLDPVQSGLVMLKACLCCVSECSLPKYWHCFIWSRAYQTSLYRDRGAVGSHFGGIVSTAAGSAYSSQRFVHGVPAVEK